MPELPEVETIRRDLEQIILGRKLTDIKVKEKVHLLQNCSARELKGLLVGQKLRSLGRRGKFLLFRFEEHVMMLHLRMSGRLLVEPANHTRLILSFSGDQTICFDDSRRFGTLHLAEHEALDELPSLKRLGLEPFSKEYSLRNFKQKLKSTQEIKRWLLDQGKIAGIGNIYANEALHLSKIHPMRTADSLSDGQAKQLFKAILKVLEHAIHAGGTSIRSYETPSGELGNFQEEFSVYEQDGEPCPRCGNEIERFSQGGRSTYFCSNCQSLDGV